MYEGRCVGHWKWNWKKKKKKQQSLCYDQSPVLSKGPLESGEGGEAATGAPAAAVLVFEPSAATSRFTYAVSRSSNLYAYELDIKLNVHLENNSLIRMSYQRNEHRTRSSTYKRRLANEFAATNETAADRHVEPVLSARPVGDHFERVCGQNLLRSQVAQAVSD